MSLLRLVLFVLTGLFLADSASAQSEVCYNCVARSGRFQCEGTTNRGAYKCHVSRDKCTVEGVCPKYSAILDKVVMEFDKRLITEIAQINPRMALSLYELNGKIVSETFPVKEFWMPNTLEDVLKTLELGDEYRLQPANPELVKEIADGKRQPIVYDILMKTHSL